MQGLVGLYLVGVVFLVRRQIHQVADNEDDEDDEDDRVVVTDNKGKTKVKLLDKVINDEEDIFI